MHDRGVREIVLFDGMTWYVDENGCWVGRDTRFLCGVWTDLDCASCIVAKAIVTAS